MELDGTRTNLSPLGWNPVDSGINIPSGPKLRERFVIVPSCRPSEYAISNVKSGCVLIGNPGFSFKKSGIQCNPNSAQI